MTILIFRGYDAYGDWVSYNGMIRYFLNYYDEVHIETYINLVKKFDKYDGIILAVAHDEFLNLDLSTIKSSSQTVVFDLKAVLARNGVDARL